MRSFITRCGDLVFSFKLSGPALPNNSCRRIDFPSHASLAHAERQFSEMDILKDGDIDGFLPDWRDIIRTGRRSPSLSEASRKEAGRAKASPARPT